MKVGIIGAGTMGSGIAQAFAQTEGYEVMLCDINETFAANGKKKIAAGFEKRIAKGKMTQEETDKILNKITTGVKDICGDCDLVVEAAIENMEIKKQTFKEPDAICKPNTARPTQANFCRSVISAHLQTHSPQYIWFLGWNYVTVSAIL